MANPESLKDKAWDKCLIYRQAGNWAKECLNCGTPKIAFHKCHQSGHWVALCPWGPKVLRSSAKPSPKVQQDWSIPLQKTTYAIMGLEPGVQLDVAGRSKSFWCSVAAYSVLTSYSGDFSPSNIYHLGCHRKNSCKTIHPSTSLLLGWSDIFPSVSSGSWVSHSSIGKIHNCQTRNHSYDGELFNPPSHPKIYNPQLERRSHNSTSNKKGSETMGGELTPRYEPRGLQDEHTELNHLS